MTIEPRHEVEANAIINANTYGIVREGYDGPVEEVTGPLLAKAIAAALADAEARGKVDGLREADAIAEDYQTPARFKVSDTWKDDMSPNLVYCTGASDVAAFIREAIEAGIATIQAEKEGP